MIDEEVVRLRKLRRSALQVRSLAEVIETQCVASGEHSAAAFLEQLSLSCWQVARLASGRLRAQPYLDYQKGPNPILAVFDTLKNVWRGTVAVRQQRGARQMLNALRLLARELGDARSLTWSTDFSDALGRIQLRLQRVKFEIESLAGVEAAAPAGLASLKSPGHGFRKVSQPGAAEEIPSSWPYLAF